MRGQKTDSHPLAGATVLVTGGTGFTGTNLLRKLAVFSGEVRCIARESSYIEDDLADRVSWFRGSVYDEKLVQRAMRDVNYVFHLATCYRNAGAEDREHWKVHVKSTRLLAEAALEQANFVRFVHTSTIGVHGHVEGAPVDEEAAFDPGDIYQETKLEGELWIRDFADRKGLPLAVVRPAAIMGPEDRRLLKLFKFAKWGVFPLLDGHNIAYHLIHVEDLTDCMILCAHDERAVGEVFICGNTTPTTAVEMLTEVGKMLENTVRFVRLPSRPLFLLADAVEWVSKRLGVEPILYRRRLAFFTKDRAFDTRKLQNVMGYDYRYDNKMAIRDTAQGYLDRGWL